MSEKKISEEAFKEAEKSIFKDKVNEIKGYILSTLEAIDTKKEEKKKVEEELRILKLDLDNLRNGKFDKIKERLDKSKLAREISPLTAINKLAHTHTSSIGYVSPFNSNWFFNDSFDEKNMSTTWKVETSGTYELSNGKIFYL